MAGQSPVAPFNLPISTGSNVQNPTAYKGNIDADIACLGRDAAVFAPGATSTPSMKIAIDPGNIFNGTTLTEVGAFVQATLNGTTSVTVAESAGIANGMQVTGPGIPAGTTCTISGLTVTLSQAATISGTAQLKFSQLTGTITAPTGSNLRIDRVVVNALTGAVSVVTGTPGTTPVAPAITAGTIPVARILLNSSVTAITNSMITDERNISLLGLGSAATTPIGTSGATIPLNNTNNSINTQQANLSSAIMANMAAVQNSMLGGFINKIRNGFMDVNQRTNTGPGGGTWSISSGSNGYSLDGWILVPTGAAITWQQAANAVTVPNRGKCNAIALASASGLTGLIMKQRIESIIAQELAGQQVSFQITMRNDTGFTFTPKLFVNTPTATDNYTSVTSQLAATNLQTASATVGSITTHSYSFLMPTAATLGVEIGIDFGGALNIAGALKIYPTAAELRSTPGVTTGLLSSPPVPEYRQFPQELELCRRYWRKSYSYSDFIGSGGPGFDGSVAFNGADFYDFGCKSLRGAPMRVAPTITPYSTNTGNAGTFYENGAGDVSGSCSGGDTGYRGFCSSNNMSNGFAITWHWTANAEL